MFIYEFISHLCVFKGISHGRILFLRDSDAGGRNNIDLHRYGHTRRVRLEIRNNGGVKALTTPDPGADANDPGWFFPPTPFYDAAADAADGPWLHVAATASLDDRMALFRDGATHASR